MLIALPFDIHLQLSVMIFLLIGLIIHVCLSLKELYGDDETEDEEVYNQEIEDDDDDEIVVEQTYPWIKEPLYDQTKSNDDDNEDIEDLLNPHVNSQTQQ